MKDDIVITLDRKQYRWHYDPSAEVASSWSNEQTNMAATTLIENQLNRILLDTYGSKWLDEWGKDNLSRFYRRLRALGAGEQYFIKFGLGFLFEPEEQGTTKPRSPLHALGYQVGKKGLPEIDRHVILSLAFTYELPQVGTPAYMAQWGIPGSAQRLRAIANHIACKCIGSGRPGSDTSQAEQEWRDDLAWLKKAFFDGKFDFEWSRIFSYWQ